MEEIINKPWEYILYKTTGNGYILSVVCGSVATFILNIPLLAEESDQYEAIGKPFIDKLASQIQYSPSSYKDRHVELGNA